jgi:mRNA-degrading endonuclease RelE of RelBE toxin-antitoxin system
MSEVVRRYRLIVDALVYSDIARIKSEDSYACAEIVAFIEEIKADQILCENLIDEHYFDATIENVVPFWAMQSDRLNVYRIKLNHVGKWRILTAGDHRRREVAILAVMHRDQNYEKDKNLIERLRGSYEKLNFGELGR